MEINAIGIDFVRKIPDQMTLIKHVLGSDAVWWQSGWIIDGYPQ
jgi:hypothetical protein